MDIKSNYFLCDGSSRVVIPFTEPCSSQHCGWDIICPFDPDMSESDSLSNQPMAGAVYINEAWGNAQRDTIITVTTCFWVSGDMYLLSHWAVNIIIMEDLVHFHILYCFKGNKVKKYTFNSLTCVTVWKWLSISSDSFMFRVCLGCTGEITASHHSGIIINRPVWYCALERVSHHL